MYARLPLSPRVVWHLSMLLEGADTAEERNYSFYKQYSMTCLVFLDNRKAGNEIEIIKECRLMAALFGVQNSF